MKITDLYPSRFLVGADLQGRSVRVTVQSVKMERVYDRELRSEIDKPVVYFRAKEKGCILGKRLAFQIAGILGDDLDLWPGKEITLFAEPVLAYGRTVLSIQARKPEQVPAES